MTWYLGIDPGKHGAAVAISREQIAYQDWDGPGKARDWINYLLDADKIKLAVIEDVNQRRMPDKGRYAAYDLGRYSGYWEMLFTCFGIDYKLVAPKVWQSAMIDPICKFEKNAKHRSLSSARAIDPTVASIVARVKDNNRSDAALMAAYANLLCRSSVRNINPA